MNAMIFYKNKLARFALDALALLAYAAAVAAPATSQTLPVPSLSIPNYDVPIHGHGKYAPSPDGMIYYETEGSGPPVFLVAGGPGGSHASFHPFFSILANAGHTVVYFDNIGRGRSSRLADPSRYTVERDADDIEALRKALGYDSIDLLGHSYGGMPALAYAIKYPGRVKHLILSDTLLGAKTWQENIDTCNYEASIRFPEEWLKLTQMRKDGVKTSADEYENLYGNATDDLYWANPDHASLLFKSGDEPDKLNISIYEAILGDDPEWKVGGTLANYDPSKKAKGVNCPVLVCVGRFDRVASPKIAGELASAFAPGVATEVVFEHSGHRPWVEETPAYFSRIEKFLDSNAAGAPISPETNPPPGTH